MEDRIDKLLVNLIRLPGVEQGVIDVGRPVVKGGEQEAQLWRGDDLAGGAVVELVLSRAAMAL